MMYAWPNDNHFLNRVLEHLGLSGLKHALIYIKVVHAEESRTRMDKLEFILHDLIHRANSRLRTSSGSQISANVLLSKRPCYFIARTTL